jgi:hypothetical protein
MKHRCKKIPSSERANLVTALSPSSFFDALYRIRARSNYQDVDSFTFGNVSISDANVLHNSLVTIIYYTLFMFEMMIVRSIGKSHFETIVNEFLESKPGSRALDTIGTRWEVIQNHI